MDQPTQRREYTSITAAQYTQPCPVRCWVMSVTHNRSGRSAVKRRSTRSGQVASGGLPWRHRRRCTPCKPASRISRATRLWPSRSCSANRSSAWQRRTP